MTNNKPVETFRRGNIEAAVWKNVGEKGEYYNVTFNRTYREGDEVKNSPSFGQHDLLRVARVAELAEEHIFKLLE